MKLIIALLLAVFSTQLFAKTDCILRYVVSDFDDTIKTYGRDQEIYRLANAFVARKINAGMPELLKNLSTECELNNQFTVLTASPSLFAPSIKRLLNYHSINQYDLITRPLNEKTLAYKISRVNKIFSDVKKPLILIGDDTSKDPDAYFDFALKNPTIHHATYIHRVRNRAQLIGQINYSTSYEVALHEYLANRLSSRKALEVGLAILATDEMSIIPRYAFCPLAYNLPKTENSDLEIISQQIKLKVEHICRNR